MAAPPVSPFSQSQADLESLRAQADRTQIEVISPDGSVMVSVSRRRGLVVEFPVGARPHMDERSLAGQAGQAVSAALTRYAERIIEIADTEFPHRARRRGAAAQDRADRFEAEVARIRAVAESPTGQVVAARTGDGPVQVELVIHAGALHQLTPELLAAEISAAVGKANRSYQSGRTSIYSQICMERIWRAAANFDAGRRDTTE